MKRACYILLFLIVVLNPLWSQADNSPGSRIVFQGIIRDAASLSPLPGSRITINRSFAAYSDSAGSFSLMVSRRDTLEFHMLGYRSAQAFISDTLPGREYMAGIYLNSDTISIGEVIIIPRLANLRSTLFNPRPPVNQELENARNNLALAAYQAKVTIGNLGDPSSNYELIKQQQRTEAYEKGQISSSRMVGLSPFMIVPAMYLLMNGFPQKPAPAKSNLTEDEISNIQKRYLESVRKQK